MHSFQAAPMTPAIVARGLTRRYGKFRALDQVNFEVGGGRTVGLIGPNGAGKTTALRAILGLTPYEGELEVLGLDPYRQRAKLMQEVAFIADVAVLPRWLRARQALAYCAAVHPRFRPERAQRFLERTSIEPASRVRELSKGMITQLHLALVMAIDARLLVLDEPTLGLDILYRQQFYESVLEERNKEQTILVTTHQVEEVESILTDLIFMDRGRVVLDASMAEIARRFVQVTVHPERIDSARELLPFHERQSLGRTVMFFETSQSDRLHHFGELRTPSVADLFVAKIRSNAA